MRIAYHISVHHKPLQFKWLFDTIYNSEDLFAIHIDRKTPEPTAKAFFDIVGNRPNVHLSKEHSVIYGEWALCEVELDGIMYFLKNYETWDYFINMSGQDFPLKNREQIVAELSKNPTQNYINLIPLNSLPRYFKMRKNWFCFRLGDRFIRTPIPRIQPLNMRIDWHGSAWHILTHSFCDWIFSADAAQECTSFLRHVKLPNEFLMQTLIMNSPFRETLNTSYKRKMIWKKRAPHPRVLTMEDYPLLVDSDAFFARKFDPEVDEAILHALVRHISVGS